MTNTEELLQQLEVANKLIADQKYALDQAAIVAVTDKKGVITYVNDKFCNISGYSEEELIGKTHRIINSGFHPQDFFKHMWNTIAEGKVWHGEVCNRTKDKSIYWVDTTIVPFLDTEGKPYQHIAIRYEITHKKKAEEELKRERERVFNSEKMASLGIMSAGISHELGNPLGALRGRLEMLGRALDKKETLDKEKTRDSIENMIGLVDRMSKIIRGLRSYARDDSQDPFEIVDLGTLLSDIIEISRDRFRKHKVEVRGEGFGQQSFKVLGHQAELGQVIVNLLNNAIDAVKQEDEKWVKMSLSLLPDGNISLSVEDSGPGVPEEVLSKIFDPFYTTKPAGKGTGLGLSISYNIIQKHGGQIQVDSEVGQGTTFRLTLPVRHMGIIDPAE